MSQPLTTSARIEILAPPSVVRSVFLGFSQYQNWQQGWEIQVLGANKQPEDLQPGDRLRVSMHGMVFRPDVLDNTPECFIWIGSLWGLVSGKHYFHFSPSHANPGGTTFIQHEEFSGLVARMAKPFMNSESPPSENWVQFNAALKKEAESRFHSSSA